MDKCRITCGSLGSRPRLPARCKPPSGTTPEVSPPPLRMTDSRASGPNDEDIAWRLSPRHVFPPHAFEKSPETAIQRRTQESLCTVGIGAQRVGRVWISSHESNPPSNYNNN